MQARVQADWLAGQHRLTEMPLSAPFDGFRLAYDRAGAGPPAVLLHGWPGWRADYRDVVDQLGDHADVVVPDLRGFGGSDRHDRPPREAYSAEAQAESVLGLIRELELNRPVLVGYDIGGRIARVIARDAPASIRALVLSPPLPGAGERILSQDGLREFWYQPFHRLPLAHELIDGDPDAVRAYLGHFWEHWSAPGWALPADRFDELVALYARPGAFAASIAWYRAGSGAVSQSASERPPAPADRIGVPTAVLWGEHEPLFPPAWADRLEQFHADITVQVLAGAGHFAPLEAPAAVADATARALRL
jgi:pimeloyl-ACP methyl ester carboxylesterase